MSELIEYEITDELQDEFIALVHARVGILVKRNHRELIKTIMAACHKFQLSPVKYLNQLQVAEDNSPLLGFLVSAITIGETYFFRDKQQVKTLVNKILPEMINRKIANNQRTIRIWSAGCSSGEEIFSIIMLLDELLGGFEDWQCHFLATDINLAALKKGMAGLFSEWSMRSIPPQYLAKYFTHENNQYQLHPEIVNKVTFDYLNLVSESYPSILNGTMMQDLIICRNVLIYFDNEHIKTIMNKLSKCIADDGYVMLGASDPIAMLGTDMATENGVPSLFKKKMAKAAEVAAEPVVRHLEQTNIRQLIPEKPKIVFMIRNSVLDKYTDQYLTELMNASKWQEVVLAIDQINMTTKSTPFQLTAKATALANLGRIKEAIQACEECLLIDKMNKEIYFIYALSLAEINRLKEAESAFRKAIYIDPDYIICRYQFGLFLMHLHRYEEGIKALNNTIQSAQKYSPEEEVSGASDMKYGQLISIINNEVELHQ